MSENTSAQQSGQTNRKGASRLRGCESGTTLVDSAQSRPVTSEIGCRELAQSGKTTGKIAVVHSIYFLTDKVASLFVVWTERWPKFVAPTEDRKRRMRFTLIPHGDGAVVIGEIIRVTVLNRPLQTFAEADRVSDVPSVHS